MNSSSLGTAQLTFGNIALIAGSIAAVWLSLWYIGRAFKSISDERPRTLFPLRVVESALRILLWFSVFMFAMRLVALGQNALYVSIGSAALAIGLGSRDLIKNLIGGLVIIAERPYELGDRVTMAGATGEIERIGLRATRITTPDGALVTVPNSKLLDGIARNDNPGTPECAVATEILVPAHADPELALRVGREVLITSPYLCLRRPTAITLVEGLSQVPYLVLRLNGYVYDHRFESQMRTDLVRRCRAEFGRLGALQDQLQ
jgi:small-conductance mechanosensitive channel